MTTTPPTPTRKRERIPIRIHGVVYSSMKEAAKALGMNVGSVHGKLNAGVPGFEFMDGRVIVPKPPKEPKPKALRKKPGPKPKSVPEPKFDQTESVAKEYIAARRGYKTVLYVDYVKNLIAGTV